MIKIPGYAKPPSYNANNISITPAGDISSTTLQAGLEELDSDLSGGLASKPAKTSSATQPASPESGDIWYDTNKTPPTAFFYDGTNWQDFYTSTATLVRVINTSGVASVSIDNVFDNTFDYYEIQLSVESNSPSNLYVRPRDNSPADTGVIGWWVEVRDRQNVFAEYRSGVISSSIIDVNMTYRHVHNRYTAKIIVDGDNRDVDTFPQYIRWSGGGGNYAGFGSDGMFANGSGDLAGLRFFVTGSGVNFEHFRCAIYGIKLESYS